MKRLPVAHTRPRAGSILDLEPRLDLATPRPLRVAFPVLLDGDLVESTEHLGVAYLASVLRNAGAACRIIEVPVHDLGDEEAADEVAAWGPDIVGLTLTTVGVGHATRFGTLLRRRLPSALVFAGGPLATHSGAALLDLRGWEFLDGLVRGEGEIAVLRLAEAIHSGESLSLVPNLCYRTGASIVTVPELTAVHDLDELPFPARDQFERHSGKLPFLRISTSRGCTSSCTFCNAPHARNPITRMKVWRGASPRRVVDEIELLADRYDVDTFDFVDSTFEDPGGREVGKRRVAAIAQEILRRGLDIHFNCCMQAVNWGDEDRPLLELLRRAGLEKVLVGLEAGSDDALELWNKRSRVADNVRVIRLLREVGAYVVPGFITWHPYLTFDMLRANVAFLGAHVGHNLRPYTTRLELYPGAEIVDLLRRDRLLLPAYDEALDPFAYSYRDPRIGRLASLLRGPYGGDGVEGRRSTAVRFEAGDLQLHTFMSRLGRAFGDDALAREILDEASEAVDLVRRKMSDHNSALVGGYVERGEHQDLTREEVWARGPALEAYFAERIREIETIRLVTSVRLHRAGCAVDSIAVPATAAA